MKRIEVVAAIIHGEQGRVALAIPQAAYWLLSGLLMKLFKKIKKDGCF